MRDIKFRAIISGTDKFIYGFPHSVYKTGIDSIRTIDGKIEYIRIDTLGEFTGLKDKNSKEIYRFNILKTKDGKIMIVDWSDKFASFVLKRDGWAFCHWFGESCNPEDCEIIGNKFQNPELLK